MKIETGADMPTRVGRSIENEECRRPAGLSAVPDELETNDPGPINAFDRAVIECNALSKLARYEASIERIFYRALHELQRAQAARAGVNVPPPAAIDLEVGISDPVDKDAVAERD